MEKCKYCGKPADIWKDFHPECLDAGAQILQAASKTRSHWAAARQSGL